MKLDPLERIKCGWGRGSGGGGGGGETSNNAKSAACQGQAVFQSAGKTRRGLGSVVTYSAPCLPCQSARGNLRKLSVSLSLTFPVLQLRLLTPRVSLGVGGGGGGEWPVCHGHLALLVW